MVADALWSSEEALSNTTIKSEEEFLQKTVSEVETMPLSYRRAHCQYTRVPGQIWGLVTPGGMTLLKISGKVM